MQKVEVFVSGVKEEGGCACVLHPSSCPQCDQINMYTYRQEWQIYHKEVVMRERAGSFFMKNEGPRDPPFLTNDPTHQTNKNLETAIAAHSTETTPGHYYFAKATISQKHLLTMHHLPNLLYITL